MNMKIMLTAAVVTLIMTGVQGPIKFGATASQKTAPSTTQAQQEQPTQKPVTAAASAF